MERTRDRAVDLLLTAITEPAPLADWTQPSTRPPEPSVPRTPLQILAAVVVAVVVTVGIALAQGWRP